MERLREDRRLRRSFDEWSPVCKHVLESLGSTLQGKTALLYTLLIFFFGRHNLFWYVMRRKLGYRVVVDRFAFAWHLYDVKDIFSDFYISYEQFCDLVYNSPVVTISFAMAANSQPSGFCVMTQDNDSACTTELSERALIDLLRRQVFAPSSTVI